MIKEVEGNLLTYPGLQVIGHQTNCLGVMGAGIAKQIKAKNPYDHYQIQSAQTIASFDSFDDWEREYPQFKENSDERTAALQNCGGINERSVTIQNGFINNFRV